MSLFGVDIGFPRDDDKKCVLFMLLLQRDEETDFYACLFRARPAKRPARPVARSSMVAGSGTGST